MRTSPSQESCTKPHFVSASRHCLDFAESATLIGDLNTDLVIDTATSGCPPATQRFPGAWYVVPTVQYFVGFSKRMIGGIPRGLLDVAA